MSSYYIVKPDGSRVGPYELSVVKSMMNDGFLESSNLVWTQGWTECRTLDSIIAPQEDASVRPELKETSADASAEPHVSQAASSPAGAEKRSVWYNPISAFRSVALARYATFRGRASRSEYCWYSLVILLAAIPLSDVLEEKVFFLLWLLVLPSIALPVRRAHDAGYSGWYLLVPFFGICLYFLPSAPPNKWGEGPEPPAK